MTTLGQLRNLFKLMEVYDGDNDFKYDYKVEIYEDYNSKVLFEFLNVNEFIDELPTSKDNYVIEEFNIFVHLREIEIIL